MKVRDGHLLGSVDDANISLDDKPGWWTQGERGIQRRQLLYGCETSKQYKGIASEDMCVSNDRIVKHQLQSVYHI